MRLGNFAAIIALASLTVPVGAHAQLGLLLGKKIGTPEPGVAGGSYQSNNQIRTYVSAGPYAGIDLFGKAIVKAAEMTRDKGYARFGMTKHDCSTTLMSGRPIVSSCYVIAIMLNDGEEAKPRGKRKVLYYGVYEVLAGNIARPEPD